MSLKTSIQRSVIATMLVLTIATAAVPAPRAEAATLSELQAQIAMLMAQINTLQAQLGQGGSSNAATMCPYTWTRSLSQGSTGADVLKLQQFLNASADTRVAAAGAGSAGMETQYFGPATAAAVSKFQIKYRNDVLAPSGLVNPTGFFGPASLAKANTLCVTAPNPTPNPTPEPEPTPDDSDLTGDGELSTFEIDNASDTDIQEGAKDEVVAELTLEARYGDIRIDRMDLSLSALSGNTEKDPWDTFKNISIWVDGEKVTSKDIDERSDYQNRNTGTIRLSKLDLVLPEGDEVEVLVAVTVQDNIKGAGSNASWEVSVDRLRYFDADDVATDDSNTGDLKDKVSFDIVERGDGEELAFGLGTDNPSRTDIIVKDDKRTNNVTILEYTIKAEKGDIDLEKLFVNIETDAASFANVVHDVRLVIDGKTFKKEAVLDSGSYTPTSVRVMFDIDGDITVDDGDSVDVAVIADLKAQSAYLNGEMVRAQVTSAERNATEAEGADDVANFSGTAVGKWHTLVSEGIIVPNDEVKFTTKTSGQNDTNGSFTIEFEVTAIEGDFYIKEFASTTAGTSTGGVRFSVETASGDPTSISAVLSSTGDEDTTGVFTVREGQTETFTLQVNVDAAQSGPHRVILEQVNFSSNTDGVTDAESYRTLPTGSFRTPYENIIG